MMFYVISVWIIMKDFIGIIIYYVIFVGFIFVKFYKLYCFYFVSFVGVIIIIFGIFIWVMVLNGGVGDFVVLEIEFSISDIVFWFF